MAEKGSIGMRVLPKIDFKSLNTFSHLAGVINDDETAKKISEAFVRAVTPFVPISNPALQSNPPESNPYGELAKLSPGSLRSNVEITPRTVRWKSRYAHYVYKGIVYEGNVPIIKKGHLLRYYTNPKLRWGSGFTHQMEYHDPEGKAGNEWDKKMLADARANRLFKLNVGNIVARAWKKAMK